MCSLGENPATGDPFTVENRFPELGFASVITPVGFQLARYRHNRPIASHAECVFARARFPDLLPPARTRSRAHTDDPC
jgi:hypothetical protein